MRVRVKVNDYGEVMVSLIHWMWTVDFRKLTRCRGDTDEVFAARVAAYGQDLIQTYRRRKVREKVDRRQEREWRRKLKRAVKDACGKL